MRRLLVIQRPLISYWERWISTFENRQPEDKYSHVAPLSEVAENDYNLNIPRYVDTFEDDEVVDLKVVAKDLKKLNKDMAKTDKVIADFCKELGINTPF